MRTLLSVILLGALALAGCVRKNVADWGSLPQPRAGGPAAPAGAQGVTTPLIVTPEIVLVAKVVGINAPGRFVVLNFPLGRMAAPEQHLNIYRRGLKVGEVKVTGPQREDNTVADLVVGEAEVGDTARSQ
jgi:hypothetical protein